ncbi:HMCN2 [Cordylochernes scorpioides]|uniref:HMCN2 n=1 Tax=Cordylochernes scorpioides TaxID=51811 RepID=A0ABY6L467_9ARAC|nr:HMCN2 [Cordylochernes scorpioides]
MLFTPGYLKIQPFTFSKSAVIGDKISTLCSPTSDNDRLTFTWLKNGKEITSGKVKVNTFEGMSTIVFNPLEEEDEGNYTCRVTSTTSGSDSFTAPLHVLVPARWDQRPPPQVQATEGTSVSLPCKGAGKPPPQSFWTGPRVTNGSSLVFPRVSRGDQGIYRCKVTNNVGPELEVSTFLAVHGYLKIQPFSFSNSAVIGDKISTTCSPTSDNDRLTFTWLKNGKEITSGKVKVNTFEGVSMIVFNPLEEEDEGNYTCRVTSTTSGSDSFTAPLHVLVPARWDQRPPPQVQATEGTSVSLPCKGAGKPPPQSFWTGPRVTNGSSLVFPRVSRGDQGIYRCKVTNNVGPELEVSTFLAVHGGIRIQPFFFSNSAVVGDKLSTTCSPTSDNERVTFTWLKDGREISGKVKINTFDGVSAIIFNPLTEEDEGNYTCRVTSPTLGSDSFTAPLHVLVPSRWEHRPPPQVSAMEGSSVSLQCKGLGKPSPSTHWTGPRVTNGSSLVFPRVSRGDQGIYRCQVTNNVGPELEAATFLAVHAMIQVQPFIFPRTAIVGQKTTAVCSTTSSGTERLSFTWLKEGRELDSRVKVNTMDGISNIIFTELTEEDEGNYTCRVTSPRSGSDSYNRPPSTCWLQAMEGTSVVLSCQGSGRPAPTSVWSGPRGVNGSSAVFPKVSRSDQGVYKCRVSNNVGPELEAATFLAVNAIVGQKISALCSTTSPNNERLSFTWLKEGRELDSRVKVNTMDGISNIIFTELTEEDEGNYTCRVTSPRSGSDSYTAPLHVLVPARWEQRPPAQLQAMEGTSVVLSCQGSGRPAPTSVWSGPRGVNGSSAVFPKVSRSDQGVYKCRVSNNVGPELEAATFLAVNGSIQVQPFIFPKTAIVGQKISALCSTTSSDNERLSFTWMKDGRELGSRVKVNTMDGISTIVFAELTEEDEGNYTCRVTSPRSGSDSYTAPLHVLVPARWEQRPPAQLQAMEGTSVVLSCQGSGRPAPTSVWSGPRGVNGSSAVFPKVSRSDQGVYKCRVSNNVGPELEAATFLAVNGFIQVQPFNFPKTAIVGQKTTAVCSTTSSGTERLSFTWLKEGRELDSRVKVNTMDGISNIIFTELTEEDEGNYTCRVPGLTVHATNCPPVPARWEQRPPAQLQAMEGTSVVLSCQGSGRPAPTSVWSGPRGVNGSSAVFPKVSRSDQGVYKCRVSNNVGPELEAATFLAVNGDYL